MTKEQAVAMHDSEAWKDLSVRDRALFQLQEPLLCMPFEVFHEAVEKTLGRPVFTHEFAFGGSERMLKEMSGDRPAPTLNEILELIPEEKRLLVVVQ